MNQRKEKSMNATEHQLKRFTRAEIEKHLTPAGSYLRKDQEAMG